MAPSSRYQVPKIENFINRLINGVFYYRLIIAIISIVAIVVFSIIEYCSSVEADKLKNLAIVLTGGSIIIGIFYSIINYEHNHIKFNHDKKSTIDALTFNIACKMHETSLLSHIKNVKQFYLLNKDLFTQSKNRDIEVLLAENEDIRISYLAMFNYFESIAIAIDQGIIDEIFMKKFFSSIFRDYCNFYSSYFVYIRREHNSPEAFLNFTTLASKWISN